MAVSIPFGSSQRLSTVYPLFRDMVGQHVMFMYQGRVTSEFISHVLEFMQEKMESLHESKRTARRVSNLMMESLSTTYQERQPDNSDPLSDAIFVVHKQEDSYHITTGLIMDHKHVEIYEQEINKLNQLPPEGVKAYHQQLLNEEAADSRGLMRLGLVAMLRKSNQQLYYRTEPLGKGKQFFALEVRLSRVS